MTFPVFLILHLGVTHSIISFISSFVNWPGINNLYSLILCLNSIYYPYIAYLLRVILVVFHFQGPFPEGLFPNETSLITVRLH